MTSDDRPSGVAAGESDATGELQPDPSLIGGVAKAPLAFLPEPVALFQARARRFAFLAGSNDLAPYLKFLAELSRLQARLSATLPPVTAVAPARIAAAVKGAMPPIDRAALADDPALAATLEALTEGAAVLEMPEPARAALELVRTALRTTDEEEGRDEEEDRDEEDRNGEADEEGDADSRWLLANVLRDQIPEDSTAPHLFVAAAVQVHLARLAATLDAGALVPVSVGVCPACGGRPVTSSVMGAQGVENVRYATCACCATQWNEVRVKCLCCGSTQGVSYRSVETAEATVKAETCTECHSWVKIFYQLRNPSLDPVADDVGSLGLDILMKETPFRRGGFNPYLVGY